MNSDSGLLDRGDKALNSQPNRLTVSNIALFATAHSFNAVGNKAPVNESKDIRGTLVA